MKEFRILFVGLILACACPYLPARTTDEPSIPRLIEQLGNEDFRVREKATRRLLALEEVPPELLEAMKSSDAEVRRRAELIVEKIEQKLGAPVLDKSARLIQNGEFDQAVERLVRWAAADPKGSSLRPLSRLAGKLLDSERRRISKNPPEDGNPSEVWDRMGLGDLLSTQKRWHFHSSRVPLVQAEYSREALRAPKVTLKSRYAFVACSGDVICADVASARKDKAGLNASVVFACGSVALTNQNLGVVIVSDGDVEVSGEYRYLAASLVIARGDVTLPGSVFRSTVIAGGRVKLRDQHKNWRECLIREHDLNGLGIIKFFDPKKQGIEVRDDKEGVRVKAVAKDKPFAAALRAGDVVTAVNGKATASPEAFRKVLRAALAEERRQLPVTIRRSGERMTVRVPMKR
jgi:hypothetical protein